ncbi:toxin YdaT family protein [Entomohabitans teleogrylli]|uniref:toxin YdaT family protein n=1 Tax=Entomohabitans teleogrylli TaxID=1384589 RepID=UPI00073D9100|nr:toxin YdaT family protein [Entomohabitans teleogrylli]
MLAYTDFTECNPGALINQNQRAAADPPDHEALRSAVRAWGNAAGQDVVAALILERWRAQGGHNLDIPDDLSRQRQKLFRWLDGDTERARANVRELAPAIMDVLPLEYRDRVMPRDDDLITRLTAAISCCGRAKQAVMLNAPEHQKLRELSQGIISLFRLAPESIYPLLDMVTVALGAGVL